MLTVLSIAGSDPTSGAGLQADIKTFFAHGVHGATVITAVTAQNSRGVKTILEIPAALIAEQVAAVCEEFDLRAVKIGMLPSRAAVHAVASALEKLGSVPVVLDPVIHASTGQQLADNDACTAMRQILFPLAMLVTPNIDEASILAARPIISVEDVQEASRRIVALGSGAVLIKGGHAAFAPATDFLFDGELFREFRGRFISDYAVHGAGCTFSSAIAAQIALGASLHDAVALAKEYVARAIAGAPDLGTARRVLNHAVPVPAARRLHGVSA